MSAGYDALIVREDEDGVRFEVRVAPRAAREDVTGVHDGALKLSLTAPPVDGAANEALIALLARTLSLPKRAVQILRGERGRSKSVRIDGLDAATLRSALAARARP